MASRTSDRVNRPIVVEVDSPQDDSPPGTCWLEEQRMMLSCILGIAVLPCQREMWEYSLAVCKMMTSKQFQKHPRYCSELSVL